MRVLVLENEPSSRRGGQELSLLDVCRGLAARGHAIELLYTIDGDLLDEYRGFCRRVDRVTAYARSTARRRWRPRRGSPPTSSSPGGRRPT